MERRGRVILGSVLGWVAWVWVPMAACGGVGQGADLQRGAMSVPAHDWAVQTAAKEVEIVEHTGSYLRYKQRLINTKGDELRDVIETREGAVARIVMRDNQPLTAEQDQSERDRLMEMISHPAEFAKHQKNEANGKKIAVEMIQLMPDAMLYSYVEGQPQTANAPGREVVIDFVPNPKFKPPTMYSEGLAGLRGRVWIDEKTKEIVRVEGEIFQPVNWGWGMLAHIYPGGKLDLEQTAASGQRWNMTSFHQDVTVKALMVKTMNVRAESRCYEFQALPEGMSYADGIRLLLSAPLVR